ncbi:YchJ family protein [Arenicella xantha]|uniref:SEC-C motif-containing protein n=1 Tax=Arenicella xantha TaxID=644221 RepID=A0A395JKY1_9GAMM|nr:YchJ family metal-binding protein [Arenicella xantha]RBP51239.1 SEC-C motif-containing protein [Arenicella xantha]
MTTTCPCNPNKLFSECCQPLLIKQRVAKTPVQLMRSRYSAYALGGYGEYLLETWLPSDASNLTAVDLSVRSFDWQGLTILRKSQQGDVGQVEFQARFVEHQGQQSVHHEKSLFRRIAGRWYYAGVAET